ncbi:MAG: hypothetical protein ACEY3B_04785 [Wolbachia sp.]
MHKHCDLRKISTRKGVIPVPPSPVIRVAPFLSSQCLFLCHPSAQTLGSRFFRAIIG